MIHFDFVVHVLLVESFELDFLFLAVGRLPAVQELHHQVEHDEVVVVDLRTYIVRLVYY